MQPTRILAVLPVLLVTLSAPARALTLLRDPDIEHGLKQLAAPVLRAAGLSADRVDILVIDAPSLNAFVVDANSIFLHSGLILRMDNPAMLQSVIAHEAAHIPNGHLMRRPVNLRNARTAAALGSILAGIAGAAAGSGEFAAGAAAGIQGAAMRGFFSHTRAEENAADTSGMRYLHAAVRLCAHPPALARPVPPGSGAGRGAIGKGHARPRGRILVRTRQGQAFGLPALAEMDADARRRIGLRGCAPDARGGGPSPSVRSGPGAARDRRRNRPATRRCLPARIARPDPHGKPQDQTRRRRLCPRRRS